jgi:hypothetical protein
MAPTRTAVDRNVASFAPIDQSNVLVLGKDGKLWLESAPFGNVPPSRLYVDSGIKAYKPVRTTGEVLVLKADRTLWLYENPKALDLTEVGGHIHIPPPVQIDANVADFYSYDGATVYVLGTDGHLWQESAPFGKVPPARVPVDVGVKAFTPVVNFTPVFDLLVLGADADSTLLMEGPPFGSLPPSATAVDRNVVQFSSDTAVVYVLDRQRNLWVEKPPFGVPNIPPKGRLQVDGNVKTFRQAEGETLFVLSTDDNGTLWFEFPPYGRKIPPERVQIDSNVATFGVVIADEYYVYVLDRDGALWLWTGPFVAGSVVEPGGGSDQDGDGGGGVVDGPGGTIDDGPDDEGPGGAP